MKKIVTTSALIAGTLCQSGFAATWSGADADWSNATEWGGTVPGSGDSAVINSGTVTVTTNQTVNQAQIGFGASANGSVVIDNGGTLTVNGNSNWGQLSGAQGSLTVKAGGRFDLLGSIDGFTGGATGMTIRTEGGQFTIRNTFYSGRGDPLNWDLQGGVVSIKSINQHASTTMTFAGTSTLAVGEIGTAGRTTFGGGSLAMTENSTQHFDIGGTTQAAVVFQDGPGTYDLLNMNGQALSLGGNLAVSLINGFASSIQNTDSFTIVLGATLTGSYDNVAFGGRITTAGNEGSFLVSQVSNTVRLTDWQAIPEPGTYALLAGLTGLTFVALRRRSR